MRTITTTNCCARRETLVVVAHAAEIVVAFSQRPHNQILRVIRILILVNQDVLESVLMLLTDIRRFLKEAKNLKQHIVEVECASFP